MSEKIEAVALKPCPFCGKSDLDQWPCEFIDGSGTNVVRCAWCHGCAPIAAWNRRDPAMIAAPKEPGHE